jgi:ketosteroid isomerase-like protein
MDDLDAKALAYEVLAEMTDEGGDLGSMEDAVPGLTAFIERIAAPGFFCRMVGGPPASDLTYEGTEGLATAWKEWGSAFKEVRATLEEVRESDDHIVLLVNQAATTRHDEVEISHPSAMVWSFENGRLTSAEFHLDRAAALRSAGLEP